MLEIITFTGVDARTDLLEVQALQAQYPHSEFGILVGSRTGLDNPIYPSLQIVENLRKLGIQAALHLCGKYAREAAGEEPPSGILDQLCQEFGRVQINLHGDEFNPRRVRAQDQAVRHFAESCGADSLILQHRESFENLPVLHPRVEYLFDRSEGGGVESFHEWPKPPPGRRYGYSGGLGAHNIHRALEFSRLHQNSRLWFDMEGNIRTPDYWMDLGRVRKVCERAFPEQIERCWK